MERSFEKAYFYLLIFAGICSCVIVWYGAEGLRGTDQYWYIADVEKIMNGEALVTNTYFPGEILRNQQVPEKNYIHHNSPMLYVVASMSYWLGGYNAWITINLIFHFLIAISIFFITIKLTSKVIASLVTAFYLVSPIAIWQTINPLLEMYFSALVALSLLLYFFRGKRPLFGILLWFVLFLGVVSHPIFMVPAMIYGVIWISDHWFGNKILSVAVALVCWLVVMYLQTYKSRWFPSSFQPDIRAIIGSVVPGNSNMIWHYSDVLPEIDSGFLLEKARVAFVKHFLNLKLSLMYVFTNLALLLSIFLLLFKGRLLFSVLMPLAVFGIQYISMIVLQQNHPRYQQIIVVVTFIVIALAIHNFRGERQLVKRWVGIAAGLFFLVCVGVSTYMANTSKRQAVGEAEDVKHMAQAFSVIPEDARLVSVDLMPHNPMSYVLMPRDVLFVRSRLLSRPKIDTAVDLFNAEFLIIHADKTDWIDGEMALVDSVNSARFGEIAIFRKRI